MFVKARTRRKPKFIGWSSPRTWWFMVRMFELQMSGGGASSDGPVFHVRFFCANWLLRPRRTSIKGWRSMKEDALS